MRIEIEMGTIMEMKKKNGGKNYQYGDACRAQTFPPYDCHLPENCCYLNTDCDMLGLNKGQLIAHLVGYAALEKGE
ncbi:MAG: hypothetical protein ACP5PR_01085 [Minisyncoccia bacterium]